MPLATHPNVTFEVVLSIDEDLPKTKRPVFIFRYVSIAEWEEIAGLSDEFDEATDSKQMVDIAMQIIKKLLVTWRNMKTPSGQIITFNIKKLKSLISLKELTELMMAAVSQRPSILVKKKLDSQSPSSTARAAKTAKA